MGTSARLLIIVGLVVGASSFAGAEILSYLRTDNFAGDAYSYRFTMNNETANPSISIPRFNVANATLNSVTVRIWDTGNGTIVVKNTGAIGSGNVTLTAFMVREYNISVPGVATGMPLDVYYAPAGPTYRVVGLGPQQQVSRYTSFSNEVGEYIADNLAPYRGSGYVSFTPTTPDEGFAWGVTGSGSNANIDITSPETRVGVEVLYDYTMDPPVPEPASLALLPMMLGGLMFWRRRRAA